MPPLLSFASLQDIESWWNELPHRPRALVPDEPLFHRGDRISAMFLVERGSVRLERRTRDGRHLILHRARPGELVAEASLFADRYHCDASAAEETAVRCCARADFLAALTNCPPRALAFGARLAAQLQTTRQRLELRNVRAAPERILLHLELNADPETRSFIVGGRLQDIAAELGLSREAFYRSLATLERSGRIRRDGRVIRI